MVASQQNQRTLVSHSQQLVKPKRPLGCGLRDAMPVAVDAKPASTWPTRLCHTGSVNSYDAPTLVLVGKLAWGWYQW